MIHILPLSNIGEVMEGDDLGGILANALACQAPEAGDVLVVTQKVVSKAEGRYRSLADVIPSRRAFELSTTTGKDARLVELVLSESTDIVRAAPHVLITRHRLGLVMANAGIDASNLGAGREGQVLLLPEDPDASAARLRSALPNGVAVLISDSFGRPWRHGVTNVCIGAAGFPAFHDQRGLPDRDGRVLQMTQVAYGDLIACAAGLAMGEGAEGVPAALARGCALPEGDVSASALIRPLAEDLFR